MDCVLSTEEYSHSRENRLNMKQQPWNYGAEAKCCTWSTAQLLRNSDSVETVAKVTRSPFDKEARAVIGVVKRWLVSLCSFITFSGFSLQCVSIQYSVHNLRVLSILTYE